ncbi:MAG: hypothetical protein ACU0CO_03150 [Shimia sp.]
MEDEAFKKAVLDGLEAINDRIDAMGETFVGRFDHVDRRMDALSARMDDVENRLNAVATRTDHVLRSTEQLQLTANEALREARNGVGRSTRSARA